jgi:hypothetical protein
MDDRSCMKFLFQATAFTDGRPVYYRLYKTDLNSYYAEDMNDPEKSFRFCKQAEEWRAPGGYESVVEQIGDVICNRMR